jgi:hypothetical protein
MAMDATSVDTRPSNAASTIDDARVARFNPSANVITSTSFYEEKV